MATEEQVQADVGPPFSREAISSGASRIEPALRSKPSLMSRLWQERLLVFLVLPGLIYYLVFFYIPLLGNVIAFQNYQPYLGFQYSPFVGLENFTRMFHNQTFYYALRNTLEITVLQLLLYFPAPIALAVTLHSVLSNRIRRFIQSVVYLPHFISWVIVVIIWQEIFGGAGVLDQLLRLHGVASPLDIMSDPSLFKLLVTAQVIWKEGGWGTIIFLAALTSIDITLYEAAAVDGANAWRRLWSVTIPGIMPIIILLLILRLGTTLSVGFEQILLQQDAVGTRAGEVLDTFVYYHGIVDGNWGMSAAVGLIKGVVGFILVVSTNWLAHRLGQQGVM
ncbi:MAG: ABC transporter permease subunit [Chloroflexi bacterium]|nr:ABC transporter permease subunit [Chloroflexota bacterium]